MNQAPTTEHVTVVLPTHGRPAGLRQTLMGLARQEAPGVPWDVVVVDNNEVSAVDATRAVFDEVTATFLVRARLIREPRNGSAYARNRGINEASGTIVAFIDDDVVPGSAWLRHLLMPILAGRCDGTGGRVSLDPTVSRPAWFSGWMVKYLAEYQPTNCECDIRCVPELMARPYVLTASAAFRSGRLRDVGGFDPRLGPRQSSSLFNDDLSLCRRFLDAGGTIRYTPKAVVVHELPRARLSRRYILRRLYGQGRSDWLLDHEIHRYWFSGVGGLVIGFFRGLPATVAARGWMGVCCDTAYSAGFIREVAVHAVARPNAGEKDLDRSC